MCKEKFHIFDSTVTTIRQKNAILFNKGLQHHFQSAFNDSNSKIFFAVNVLLGLKIVRQVIQVVSTLHKAAKRNIQRSAVMDPDSYEKSHISAEALARSPRRTKKAT